MDERVHCPCHFACEKRLGAVLDVLQDLARRYRQSLGGGKEPKELRAADAAIVEALAPLDAGSTVSE